MGRPAGGALDQEKQRLLEMLDQRSKAPPVDIERSLPDLKGDLLRALDKRESQRFGINPNPVVNEPNTKFIDIRDLPEYASGGNVHMADGGRYAEAIQRYGQDRMSNLEEDRGGISPRSWFREGPTYKADPFNSYYDNPYEDFRDKRGGFPDKPYTGIMPTSEMRNLYRPNTQASTARGLNSFAQSLLPVRSRENVQMQKELEQQALMDTLTDYPAHARRGASAGASIAASSIAAPLAMMRYAHLFGKMAPSVDRAARALWIPTTRKGKDAFMAADAIDPMTFKQGLSSLPLAFGIDSAFATED